MEKKMEFTHKVIGFIAVTVLEVLFIGGLAWATFFVLPHLLK